VAPLNILSVVQTPPNEEYKANSNKLPSQDRPGPHTEKRINPLGVNATVGFLEKVSLKRNTYNIHTLLKYSSL